MHHLLVFFFLGGGGWAGGTKTSSVFRLQAEFAHKLEDSVGCFSARKGLALPKNGKLSQAC